MEDAGDRMSLPADWDCRVPVDPDFTRFRVDRKCKTEFKNMDSGVGEVIWVFFKCKFNIGVVRVKLVEELVRFVLLFLKKKCHLHSGRQITSHPIFLFPMGIT